MLRIAETKIDSSFPTGQFSLEGYRSPYRLNVSNRRGRLLIYVNASIPTRYLKYEIKYKSIQIITFEINLRKEKWLVVSIYRPPLQNSEYFVNAFTDIPPTSAVSNSQGSSEKIRDSECSK